MFYYTGVPTVEPLKYLFEWIEPAAKKHKIMNGGRKHIPGRKGGRKRYKHFEEYILCLVKVRQGYGSQHIFLTSPYPKFVEFLQHRSIY